MKNAELEHDRIQAEIAKLMAETAKVNKELKWFEIMRITAIVVALLAAGKYLF